MQVLVPRGELGWDAIVHLYDEDRVVEAFEAAKVAGLGPTASMAQWYRTLEAEAITRERARIQPLNRLLDFEFIPGEADGLQSSVLHAVQHASATLLYEPAVSALITILAEEADAPWATHPGGYASPRVPHIKVCIPHRVTRSQEELHKTVAHEFAHVITMQYTKDEAPRWVEEGVSVYVEDTFDPIDREDFASGRIDWLDWVELESEFGLPDDTPEDQDAQWLAYQQSGWVIRSLVDRYGRPKLAEFLKQHGDESFWRNLAAGLQGQTRTDEAMRRVYGFTVDHAFAEALEYLRTA
ncbi:MAG: hypothetical protein KIT74_11185 [Fimbriimonadales bacterium]|nr:hypothetical protein [Fimbriimonadales bacterium]